ncbi:MAG TPA: hypothetical protein VFI47_18605 [Acidimicrobiales bacterium]|nr:hypothetical protein [Acidimicrobiales bacterium]
MTGSVLVLLDTEWRTLGRQPVPAGWGIAAPVLAGFRRIAAVVDACRAPGDPAAANRVLGAVLDRAAAGDALAHRTALQALLPVAAATAARLRGYVGWGPWASRADLDGEAAAALVEVVSAGVPTTPWPAAVVRSRLRDRLRTTVHRHRRQRHREGTPLESLDQRAGAHPTGALHDARSPEERAARAVVDAARGGAVSLAAAQTVLATSVYGWDTAGFAALTGRDVRAVRAHRRRTTRRLAAVADAHLAIAG